MTKPAHSPPPPVLFTPADFFVLRTPLLPAEMLVDFSEGLHAIGASDGERGKALALDREQLRAFLRKKLHDPVIRDALFIASPSLAESLPLWLSAPGSERGARVERPMVRYFQRMSGRSTPFGLFAGSSTGSVGATTSLVLPPRQAYRRHTRLDMHYLCALTDALGADHTFRHCLSYTANNSLYTSAGQLRYIEGRGGRERSYHLVSVEPTAYLLAVLERAGGEGATFGEIRDMLVSEEISEAEAEAFVHTLIDNQLLVPLLEPPVTAPQPITAVIERLSAHALSLPLAEALAGTRSLIEALDRGGPGAEPERYLEIARSLEGLPAAVELPRLLQVDMTKPAPDASLGPEIVAEISRGLSLLHSLARPDDPLEEFKRNFVARYEERELPLMEALDDECGVGFAKNEADEASPLLAKLDFPPPVHEARVDPRDPYLLGLLQRALHEGAGEIVLGSEDVEALRVKGHKPLPSSIAVLASVAATSAAAANAGAFQISLEAVAGGSLLLGRFCHADPVLRGQLEAHLRQEEALARDEIFAEIVHLPPGRVGNVICRPRLRHYEIPYLGCSSAEKEAQLPVQDLLVSVRGGRVRLRSQRLGQYIQPRMANAHNFVGVDVAMYRFLCSLRSAGEGLGWSWGSLSEAPFLPRVRHGKLLLALASWRIPAAELNPLRLAKGDQIFVEAQKLRQLRRLPRRLLLAQYDNRLPVDFDNVLSVEAFVALLKEGSGVEFCELFPAYEELIVEGEEGRFRHELVLPFLVRPGAAPAGAEAPKTAAKRPTESATAPAFPRTFAPGSRWLYAKLYTGNVTADEVLTRLVRPVVELAREAGADRWFFIRYGDPDWHIRLRVEGEAALLWQHLAPALFARAATLQEEGQIWRLQLDTYEREVERYGGPVGMVLSERLFEADSEATLGILGQLSGEEGNDLRWRLCLRGMDLLLEDMGMSLAEKSQLLQNIRRSFAEEFRATPSFERQLDAKYRAESPRLRSLWEPEEESPLTAGLALLRARSEQLRPVVAELRAAAEAGKLTVPLPELAASYLHMVANRMLRGAARAQELVMYDFLRRMYASQEARLRKGG